MLVQVQTDHLNATPTMDLPVVIVGAGPAGVRLANELYRRAPELPVVIYGAERWQPYNRVQLTAALAGEKSWLEIMTASQLTEHPNLETRFGTTVTSIDRYRNCVIDSQGIEQPYRYLVLATGSSPHIPSIPGTDLPGVFVFRDMDNAQQLAARRARTHRTIVLGGGLLGIEAARAMQRSHTEVIIVEYYDRLMPRQLDYGASTQLLNIIENAGIEIILGNGPVKIFGNTRVEGVQLRSGTKIACDTVIIATGIKPNIGLAMYAKVGVRRGIRVNDNMRTSDPRIFAIGECAEHRDQIYGLVAPGLEQANVAAHIITGGDAHFTGSSSGFNLKVLNYPVFSLGEVGADDLPSTARSYIYHSSAENIYRKIVLKHGHIIGALAMGQWDAISRIQETVTHNRYIWPWQIWQFENKGTLWFDDSAQEVQDWPANAIVCNCTGVTRGRLSNAIATGCSSVQELSACTGASTVCGSCKPLLTQLLDNNAPREPVVQANSLFIISIAAILLALLIELLPGLPASESVSSFWRLDMLWRDNIAKQISGYSLLTFALALAGLGLRKRIKHLDWGSYSTWRFIHTLIGLAVLLGFVVHTGGHMGSNLNFYLASAFIGATLTGGAYATLLAREHTIDAVRARKFKIFSLWSHILFLWPVPVLLGFHIAQGYVF